MQEDMDWTLIVNMQVSLAGRVQNFDQSYNRLMELEIKIKEYRGIVGRVPKDEQLALIACGFLDMATLDRMRNEKVDKKVYADTKRWMTERKEDMTGLARHAVAPKSTRMVVDAMAYEERQSPSEDPYGEQRPVEQRR